MAAVLTTMCAVELSKVPYNPLLVFTALFIYDSHSFYSCLSHIHISTEEPVYCITVEYII